MSAYTHFIFRRISRILPAYWIVLTAFYLLIDGIFINYLGECLTLSYWYPLFNGIVRKSRVSFWYINAAFAFYLLSFLLFPILKKYPRGLTYLIILLGISCFYLGIICYQDTLGSIYLFLARIPIYFKGLYVGYKMADLRFNSFLLCLISVISYLMLGVGSMVFGGRVITSYGLNFVLLYFIAPGLSIALAWLFRWMEHWNLGKFLNSLLSYIGTHSLELYLTHVMILNLKIHFHANMNFLVFFIMSVIAAITLKKLATYSLILIKYFSKTFLKI